MADTAAASNLPSPDAAKHKRTASSVVAGIYTAAEIGEFHPSPVHFDYPIL